MKKIIITLSVFALIVLMGCVPITNFEECVAAGNPVMESYPRQCSAYGKTFVEVIPTPVPAPEPSPEPLIGGERDEHGCLGPAGYVWNDAVRACIREWELNGVERNAARIASDYLGQPKGLTIVKVFTARCPGCFTVNMEKYGDQIGATIENYKVTNIY